MNRFEMRVQVSRQYVRAFVRFTLSVAPLYTGMGQGPQMPGRIASHSHGQPGGALHRLLISQIKRSIRFLCKNIHSGFHLAICQGEF